MFGKVVTFKTYHSSLSASHPEDTTQRTPFPVRHGCRSSSSPTPPHPVRCRHPVPSEGRGIFYDITRSLIVVCWHMVKEKGLGRTRAHGKGMDVGPVCQETLPSTTHDKEEGPCCVFSYGKERPVGPPCQEPSFTVCRQRQMAVGPTYQRCRAPRYLAHDKELSLPCIFSPCALYRVWNKTKALSCVFLAFPCDGSVLL